MPSWKKLVKSLEDNIAVADKLDISVGVSQQAKDAANEWQKSFIEALHKAAKTLSQAVVFFGVNVMKMIYVKVA